MPAGSRAIWFGKRQGSAHVECNKPKDIPVDTIPDTSGTDSMKANTDGATNPDQTQDDCVIMKKGGTKFRPSSRLYRHAELDSASVLFI